MHSHCTKLANVMQTVQDKSTDYILHSKSKVSKAASITMVQQALTSNLLTGYMGHYINSAYYYYY